MWGFNISRVNSNEHWVCNGWDMLSHFSSAQKVKSLWSMPLPFYALIFPPTFMIQFLVLQLSLLPFMRGNGKIVKPDFHSESSLSSSQYCVFHGSGWSEMPLNHKLALRHPAFQFLLMPQIPGEWKKRIVYSEKWEGLYFIVIYSKYTERVKSLSFCPRTSDCRRLSL